MNQLITNARTGTHAPAAPSPGKPPMIATQRQNHKIYASFSERGWIIINQGSPLCDYKHSYGDLLKVAAIYKITLPEVTWHGDMGKWVFTSTILAQPTK